MNVTDEEQEFTNINVLVAGDEPKAISLVFMLGLPVNLVGAYDDTRPTVLRSGSSVFLSMTATFLR